MHLAQTGAVRIDSGSYMAPKKHAGMKTVNDFYITKLVEVDAVSDPIDKATFNLLFDRVASGQNSLWFGSIKKYGEDHSEQLVNAVKNWQGVLPPRRRINTASSRRRAITCAVGRGRSLLRCSLSPW